MHVCRLSEATLAAGKFAWQMLWTGGAADSIGGTGLGPLVTKGNCAESIRSLCNATSPAQVRGFRVLPPCCLSLSLSLG